MTEIFFLATDNKSIIDAEQDFFQKLKHVKQFINEIKAETHLEINKDSINYDRKDHYRKFQNFRTNEKKRKDESPSG